MRKALLGFLLWCICIILLLGIWTLANGGYRLAAAAGIPLLLAVMYFGNRRISGENARMDLIVEPGKAPARPKGRFNPLHLALLMLWVVGIAIGAGIFGRSPLLSFIFTVVCVVGLVGTLIARSLNQNSNASPDVRSDEAP
jgi:membrane protein implicated in regulation of membrane protease activity